LAKSRIHSLEEQATKERPEEEEVNENLELMKKCSFGAIQE
jgi:hypothetical protein